MNFTDIKLALARNETVFYKKYGVQNKGAGTMA